MSERAHDPIGVLLHVTQVLSEERSLEDSLRALTDAALVLVNADHASVRLLDTARGSLLASARSGVGAEDPPVELRRGEGVLGWVLEHRESLAIDDALADGRFVRPSAQKFVIRSIMAEPLWSSGDVIGVLSVSSPRVGAFSREHRLLVRLLANCSIPPIEGARLRRLAIVDDLTLAYNVRHMAPCLEEEMERSIRTTSPLSFLLMDLDHFKAVNDEHGHAVGDRVLRLFADRVRGIVRRTDVLVRRGGEEFALLMPGTSEREASVIADRIRESLGTEAFHALDAVLPQTVSIGVATWDGRESSTSLEKRADLAMYDAKARGRNRVSVSKSATRAHRRHPGQLPHGTGDAR
jgi:diguanylate cyclase (GGDEF)-like protein